MDDSSTRTHAGSGLGLYIVKGLVTLMGGEIAVAEKEGPGTLMRFYIRLPRFKTAGGDGAGVPHGSPMGGSAVVPR